MDIYLDVHREVKLLSVFYHLFNVLKLVLKRLCVVQNFGSQIKSYWINLFSLLFFFSFPKYNDSTLIDSVQYANRQIILYKAKHI